MKKIHLYTIFGLLIVLTVITSSNNFIMLNNTISVTKNTNQLMVEIEASKEQYDEEAQDAYIDRVWKKTPARNGRKVNVKKSYNNMKKQGLFEESLLVFDEVKPSVSLKDLPASPIYRGHPEKEMVSLLINVSWGTEYIPGILKVLKNENIKATFFIEGKWAKENTEIVRMIHEQNHLIGNHAYNHPDMAKMSAVEIRDQIVKTNDIIEAIIGIKPEWFAPPSGSYNETVVNIAHELDMETILWTVDTVDWKNPSVSVMINRVMNNIHPGATILMHPTEPVAQGLAPLIQEIKQKDLSIGTIESLLSESR